VARADADLRIDELRGRRDRAQVQQRLSHAHEHCSNSGSISMCADVCGRQENSAAAAAAAAVAVEAAAVL
jgi:hypothetical protein